MYLSHCCPIAKHDSDTQQSTYLIWLTCLVSVLTGLRGNRKVQHGVHILESFYDIRVLTALSLFISVISGVGTNILISWIKTQRQRRQLLIIHEVADPASHSCNLTQQSLPLNTFTPNVTVCFRVLWLIPVIEVFCPCLWPKYSCTEELYYRAIS